LSAGWGLGPAGLLNKIHARPPPIKIITPKIMGILLLGGCGGSKVGPAEKFVFSDCNFVSIFT
jgi:hypothetical protein